METLEIQQAETQSLKDSRSEDELLDLKRLQLMKLNRLTGRETAEQIEIAWETYRAEQKTKSETEKAEQDGIRQRAMLVFLRGSLKNSGVNFPEDADEETLRSLVAENQERIDARKSEVEQAMNAERRQDRADLLFHVAGCPARATDDLIPELEENREWARIRDALVEQSEFASGYLIALLGIRGVGKTVLATSVVRACCDRLMTARYVKALNLFQSFRRAYTPVAKGKAGELEEDIVAEWVSPDMLVIDELHQRGETPFENNSLINLLDLRYDDRRCTILIANQSKEKFAEAMGDSVISRIHQTGETFICNWPSYRKPGSWRQPSGSARRTPSGIPRQSREDL